MVRLESMADSKLKVNTTEEEVNDDKTERTSAQSHSESPPTLETHATRNGTSNLDDQILSALDNSDLCQPKRSSMHTAQDFPEISSDESEGELDDGDFQTQMGYIPLPQNSDEEVESDDNDQVLKMESVPSRIEVLDEDQDNASEQGTATSQHGKCDEEVSSLAETAKLETEASEQIKWALSGFSLPSSSIPEWAKQVPEDVWKEKLMKGLQERKIKK